jgi:Formyl transferase
MLRSVFIGSPNRFTELMVDWLSKHSVLTGTVWTYSAHWAKTLSGRLQFAEKRVKRFGIRKALNETLYYLLSKKFLNESGEPYQSRLCDAYAEKYGQPAWQGESIETNDINSPEVLQFVRERSPDLIMCMCINEFFRREIRGIPRLGAFLWHEGLVPEYKGLYSPFWAIHNGQPGMLGYTLLRMNGRYDEGEVFLQDRVVGINIREDSPLYIGHKGILDSLPHVATLFGELEKGTAKPMVINGRASGSYTYPGLTDWLRYREQVRRLSAVQSSEAEMKSALGAETMRDRA